jgi:hypothetical protein
MKLMELILSASGFASVRRNLLQFVEKNNMEIHLTATGP